MKLLKGLLGGLAVLVLLVVVVGLFLPDVARVERSVVIRARPATVFTVLNGFRQFQRWSPWAGLDPNAAYTVSGPPLGVGAKSAWRSEDPNVGAGSQEILESQPYRHIRVRLVFEGFDGESYSTYALTPEGEGTRVVWGYEGHFGMNLMNRYFGLLLDGMLGKDYESGLAKLASFVESLPGDDFAPVQPELVELQARPLAWLPGEAAAEQAGPVLGELYGRIGQFLQASGLRMADAPLAITREFDEQTRFWKFDAGIPIDKPCTAPAEAGGVRCGNSYAGWSIRVRHKGPYAAMEPTYLQLIAFKTAAGLEDNGSSWEHYVTDPTTVAESELVTYVYWPVR